jgi:hypothetical protein
MRRGGKFWSVVWTVYDAKILYWALRPFGGGKLAPWLFGMMIGSKGRRVA